MRDKPITVEDYEKYGKEFFDKYFWIAKELGDNARAEDILKIMESLGGVVMKKRSEEEGKIGPFGFIRELNDDGAPVIDSPEDAPAGTVAIKTNGQWAAYEL